MPAQILSASSSPNICFAAHPRTTNMRGFLKSAPKTKFLAWDCSWDTECDDHSADRSQCRESGWQAVSQASTGRLHNGIILFPERHIVRSQLRVDRTILEFRLCRNHFAWVIVDIADKNLVDDCKLLIRLSGFRVENIHSRLRSAGDWDTAYLI